MTDTDRLHAIRGILAMITEDIVMQTRQMHELGWDPKDAADAGIAWWRSNVDSAIGLAEELLR